MSDGPSTLQLRLDTIGYRLGLTMPWSERASRRPWSVAMGAKIPHPKWHGTWNLMEPENGQFLIASPANPRPPQSHSLISYEYEKALGK